MSFVPHLGQETKGKNPDASLKGSSSGVGADAAAECELDAIARSRDLGFQHHLVWEWERRGRGTTGDVWRRKTTGGSDNLVQPNHIGRAQPS